MQVIKRDGSIAEYDRAKITIAIGKANAEVEKSERVSKEEIEDILDYIESKKKKRMLVEDIQDIIEEKMMEQGHFELAKLISFIAIRARSSARRTLRTRRS